MSVASQARQLARNGGKPFDPDIRHLPRFNPRYLASKIYGRIMATGAIVRIAAKSTGKSENWPRRAQKNALAEFRRTRMETKSK